MPSHLITLIVLEDIYVGVSEETVALSQYFIPKNHVCRDMRKYK
jgi:hypothetical protein